MIYSANSLAEDKTRIVSTGTPDNFEIDNSPTMMHFNTLYLTLRVSDNLTNPTCTRVQHSTNKMTIKRILYAFLPLH